MGKFFSRFLLASLVILTLFIFFLTYIGLKTDKFDELIKNKANEVNQNVQLGFKETKIYFNPLKLNIIVKLQNPKILIRENEIILSKLSDNGRLITIERVDNNLSKGIRITKNNNNFFKEKIFDSMNDLSTNFKKKDEFEF